MELTELIACHRSPPVHVRIQDGHISISATNMFVLFDTFWKIINSVALLQVFRALCDRMPGFSCLLVSLCMDIQSQKRRAKQDP
jgi:hypothetical protein